MEILFVSHKYPPSVGGMQKQSFELINRIKCFATVHSIVHSGEQNKIQFFLSLEKRILDTLRAFPDISVIHYNDALIASFCLKHSSYKHIFRSVTVHGLDVVFPGVIYQKFIIPAFNRFDLIIAVSLSTASACIDRGIAPEKVIVINNGVDHSLLDIERDKDFYESFSATYGVDLKGKMVLTALGRPVKRKGFSWFIDKVLPKLDGNFIFLIIGPFEKTRSWKDRLFNLIPGFMRSRLELLLGYPNDENRVRKLLIQERFNHKAIHLGKLPYQQLLQVLSATNAFVMPNIPVDGDMEGFGLVCLEASLCGAWVFASEIDGIPDAIHHKENGTLIAAESASDWILALNKFINSSSEWNKELQNAPAYTQQNFSWDKMAESYFQQFKERINLQTRSRTN